MNENYHKVDQSYSFLRHSVLLPQRKTLVFMHGIGDSGLSYLPFLQASTLTQFNILIPDFLGYGKSSKNKDYHFLVQIKFFIEHIKALEQQMNFSFNELILIPHSMAGIHAMLLCDSEIKNQIKGIVNVEGSITQYGSFISKKVATIAKDNFASWFNHFKEVTIFDEYIKKHLSYRLYYASLEFCDPEAFLQNALEMYHVCLAGTGEFTNTAGKTFAELNLPKIYCYGDKSLCPESVNFLHKNALLTKSFPTANHFVMQACFDEFVSFLRDWIINN